MNFTKECFFNFHRLRHFLTSIKQIEREKHRTMLTALHKKWSFPFRMSSVNVTKSAVSCGFGNIYWRNPEWKTLFFLQCRKLMTGKYVKTYLKTFIISQTLKPLGFLYFGFVIVHNPVSPWNEQKRDHWGAVNASKNETIEVRQPVLKLDLSLHARQGF